MTTSSIHSIFLTLLYCLFIQSTSFTFTTNAQSLSGVLFPKSNGYYGTLDIQTGNFTDIWTINAPYNQEAGHNSFYPLPMTQKTKYHMIPYQASIGPDGFYRGINLSLAVVDNERKSILPISEFIVDSYAFAYYEYYFYDSDWDVLFAVVLYSSLPDKMMKYSIISDPFSLKQNRSEVFSFSMPQPIAITIKDSYTYNEAEKLLYMSCQTVYPTRLYTISLVDKKIVYNITYPVSAYSATSLYYAWSPSRSTLYEVINFGSGAKVPVPELRAVNPATGEYKTLLNGTAALPVDMWSVSDAFDDSTGNWFITSWSAYTWSVVNVDSGKLINKGSFPTIDSARVTLFYAPQWIPTKMEENVNVKQF